MHCWFYSDRLAAVWDHVRDGMSLLRFSNRETATAPEEGLRIDRAVDDAWRVDSIAAARPEK